MLYWISRTLCHITLLFFGRMSSIGRKNVPKKGPVILAPNHVSFLDPPAVGCGIYRQVHFMAKTELFEVPVLGKLIKGLGAFPVKQNTADRAAIRRAIELLGQGRVVCMFPEGGRSPDGTLQDALPGLGMVALKSQAPIVPVALIGTEKVLRRGSPFLHFGKVKMVCGEPISFPELYDKGMAREALEEVGKTVMAAIAELQEKHGSPAS